MPKKNCHKTDSKGFSSTVKCDDDILRNFGSSSNSSNSSSNSSSNELLMQYINLIIEKQNFTLHKFDNINHVLLNLVKENSDLKQEIKSLEKQSNLLSNQMDKLLKSSTPMYDNIYDYDQTCGDPLCVNCGNQNMQNFNDSLNFVDYHDENLLHDNDNDNNNKSSKNKKKSKKNKNLGDLNNNVIVKIHGDFPPDINPMQILMAQIAEAQQNVQAQQNKNDDTCSDDGYDHNAPIYENPEDIKELDSNFVELTDKITNIKDLIDIGDKYRETINLSLKSKEKKKKNKKIKKSKSYDMVDKVNTVDTVDKTGVADTTGTTSGIADTKSSNNLLDLTNYYELDGKKYPVNLEIISKLSAPLKRLLKVIGMEKVKEDIFDMIIYYLQGFEKNNSNMLHSVIEGPPGVGKTKLGKILANIYCGLGIIPSNRFKYVKATDLIGDHIGATKHMTQQVIDEADGGVLFIDEAYALSSNDNKDPYGKECIDTLNFNLSENKKKLIVIIAGYPDHLDKYFFSFNPGLARRFPFKFRIDAYTSDELKEIFIDKLRKFGWKFNQSVAMDKLSLFFKTNEKEFPNFGGDIENFFKSCQFAHSKRMIGKHPNQRKKINFDDITNGLEKFKKNKRNDDTKPQLWKDMFL